MILKKPPVGKLVPNMNTCHKVRGFTYFDLDKRHLLTEGITDTYVDSGRVQSHGLEFELQHQVSEHLRLNANYTYTDASVVESEVEAKGARLKNIPKHTANLSADYQFSAWGKDAGVTGNINYYGKRSANYIDNGTSLPEFTTVNVGAYIKLRPDLRAHSISTTCLIKTITFQVIPITGYNLVNHSKQHCH